MMCVNSKASDQTVHMHRSGLSFCCCMSWLIHLKQQNTFTEALPGAWGNTPSEHKMLVLSLTNMKTVSSLGQHCLNVARIDGLIADEQRNMLLIKGNKNTCNFAEMKNQNSNL